MVDKRIKYFLYFLMIISLFLSIKNRVNAAELATSDFPRYSVSTGSNSSSVIDNIGNHFTNKGSGTIMFTFVNHPGISGPSLYSVRAIASDGVAMPCDLGTASYFRDSGTENVIYTAKCLVNLSNKSLNRFQFQFNSTGQIIYYGTSMQFNANDYSAYISSINHYSALMTDSIQSIQGLVNQINTNIATNNINMINAINNQTNQQHQDSQNTQQKIEDVNNTIKDSSVDTSNANNTFDSLNSNMASNSTISDLLLMPITLLQKILNAMSGTCSAINTGQLLGQDFVLPCISIPDLIGSALWSVIDVIGSGALAYAIGKKFVMIFNSFTNLKEGGLESAYD